MAKKDSVRIYRATRLSAANVAKDRERRRQIEAEFPPKARRAIPGSLESALKRAIEASNLTAYEIAKRAGVSQIVISRFLSGERDIRLETADKLATVLGLKLVAS